jgi:NADPH2 dehydrogenase
MSIDDASTDMRMDDPIPTFSYVVNELRANHPQLSYVHVVEPVINGNADVEAPKEISNEFIRQIWEPRPLISAGAFKPQSAIAHAEKHDELVAFGRYYISNVSEVLH